MSKLTLVFSTIIFTLLGFLLFIAVFDKTWLLLEHKEKQNVKQSIRYFLIGYDASNAHERSYGNYITMLDSMPNTDDLQDDVYGFLKCEHSFKKESVIITSLYEFKDSLESAKFQTKNDLGYLIQCE